MSSVLEGFSIGDLRPSRRRFVQRLVEDNLCLCGVGEAAWRERDK